MITIFSIPKPFRGEDAKRQKFALESWVRLRPHCEVVLFGNEEGIEDAANEYGVRWIENINRNEFGTPLLDDAFAKASDISEHQILCYTNGDILLHNDLLAAVNKIPYDEFLASSRRYSINLLNPDVAEKIKKYPGLKEYVRAEVIPDYYHSMDVFLFPKKTSFNLPAFAVGRPGWDQWMIFRARQMKLPVIDLTEVATVVHLLHDYKHVPHVRNHSWKGPEGDRNLALIGDRRKQFNLKHSTHILTERGIGKPGRRKSILNWRDEKLALYPRGEIPIRIFTSFLLFFRNINRE